MERLRQIEHLSDSELLANIVETSPVGITVVSSQGRIVYANLRAEEILGLTRDRLQSRLYNAPDWIITDEYGKPVPDGELPFPRVMATGEPLHNYRHAIVKADRRVLLDISGAPLHDPEGSIVGVVFNIMDVTEVRGNELELATRAECIVRSNAELEQFSSIAAHDLQEPLRSISGFLNLLRRKHGHKLDEEALHYINKAVSAANRMQTLSNDLLSMARVTTRGRDFHPVDLDAVLARVLADLQSRIEETGARITASRLPRVLGDETQLLQVLQNLLVNAMKYTGGKRPEVAVEAESEGTFARICVRDNGIGIEPEYFGRIFQLFRRLHTKSEYEGNGLGLALCKKIVERHGGRIRVESRPGEGSRFCFTIPRVD